MYLFYFLYRSVSVTSQSRTNITLCITLWWSSATAVAYMFQNVYVSLELLQLRNYSTFKKHFYIIWRLSYCSDQPLCWFQSSLTAILVPLLSHALPKIYLHIYTPYILCQWMSIYSFLPESIMLASSMCFAFKRKKQKLRVMSLTFIISCWRNSPYMWIYRAYLMWAECIA